MLSRTDNEVLTRTDPGTPMGEVMRCYPRKYLRRTAPRRGCGSWAKT